MTPPPPDDNESTAIYVLKDGARLGPFTEDDLLEMVDEGELSYDDPCLREGSATIQRIRQVLDWEGERGDETERNRPTPEILDSDDDDEEESDDMEEPAIDPPVASRRKLVGPPRNPNLILYAGHPSVLSFPKALLLIVACVGGGIYGHDQSQWWLFGGLVAALFGVSWILLQRSMRLYLITPRRVEIVTGLIAKSSKEVRIEDIRTINVLTPGIRGLFGVGSVEFASSGGSSIEVAFTEVYAAHRIKGLVRRIQDALDDED
ncbi:MAG: PH domain-containing protein [Verrucomicrobiae bacterium]|nr:PH domain-containing protein [Verrucomicrobiae bacterium]